MRFGKSGLALFAVLCGLFLADAGTLCAQERLPVFVSILPQKYLAQRVGGERVAVEVLVAPGRDPETYAPSVHQMAQLAKAKIWFRLDVPFEAALLEKVASTMPQLLIVDTSADITKREISEEEEGHAGHKDEPKDEQKEHAHEGEDPHVWLDPLNAVIIAGHMREELAKLAPEHAQEFADNYQKLAQELAALNEELAAALAPLKGQTLYVFHPAFGYFCDRYGLKQEAVETGGQAPRPAILANIIKHAREEGVRVIFVQPQFDQSAAQKVAEAIGGAVAPLDPLAEDYFANLRAMKEAIVSGLGGETGK